eukprot:12014121-Alexandrium_andersonii.AAC.1
MSASLVGSEMCIRDSFVAMLTLHSSVFLTGAFGSISSKTYHGGALWREPVSYTHLTLPTICSV